MEIKKLTSDVCIGCNKTKQDSYNSFCDNCRVERGSWRECLGCRQPIGCQTTACQECRREEPLRLAIIDLQKRVAALEASRDAAAVERYAGQLRKAW